MIIMHSIIYQDIWHDDEKKIQMVAFFSSNYCKKRTTNLEHSSVGFIQKDVDICAMQLWSMAFSNLFISLGYFLINQEIHILQKHYLTVTQTAI